MQLPQTERASTCNIARSWHGAEGISICWTVVRDSRHGHKIVRNYTKMTFILH